MFTCPLQHSYTRTARVFVAHIPHLSALVISQDYLGLRIFRFYIRCPKCASAITFKTDPKNTDYVCETGATRNFENWRVTDDTGEEEIAQEELDEQNPMAALERRTEESKREIDILDALEELKDANEAKFNIDIDQVCMENTSCFCCQCLSTVTWIRCDSAHIVSFSEVLLCDLIRYCLSRS